MSTGIQINHLKATPRTVRPVYVPGPDGLIRPNGYQAPSSPSGGLKDLGKLAFYLLLTVLVVPVVILCFLLPPVGAVSAPVALVVGFFILFHHRDKKRQAGVDRLIQKLDEKL